MLQRAALRRPLGTRRPAPRPLRLRAPPASRPFSWTPWRSPAVPAPILDSSIPGAQPLPPSAIQSELSQAAPIPPADISALAPADTVSQVPQTLENLILHSGKSLPDVLNSEEAVHASMKVSDLSLMGYEHGILSPMGWFTDGLVALHTSVGLPWWGAIAVTTVAIRLALSPLIISNQKHSTRLAAVNPQLQELMAEIQSASKSGDTHMQALVSQRMQELMRTHKVNPFKPLLLPLFQVPIFLTFFSIVRGLTALPIPQFKEGGFGWIMDLTASDPYYILPLTSLAFTNLVFVLGADGVSTAAKSGATPERTAHIRNFVQMSTVISFPFIMHFPAALLCYWTFSTGFTLLQSLALRQNIIRKMLGLPITPAQVAEPGAASIKDPSYLDTLKAIKNFATEKMDAAREQALEQEEEKRLAQRRAVNKRPQTDFVEKIQETTAEKEMPVSRKKVDSREAEKQRRIEEARKRRSRA
ncbi:preprotein translocase subunit YidC [Cryptococcus wingfieldii CBS 7118]|uniref:Preprotein translocase subunit YidC n=1 Tax=Cryptococcus wingfieldii CBS 7118 TaxID=1295528 RepID=A0A1E3JL39_9TREE|nr:preprotein translocase subunit YidC [Cryptococcus wingfieldii CBS 7118]ODO00847.1 preprotein translocase subunit YidC [Cryptococcus wingfieldii CBS 7118]